MKKYKAPSYKTMPPEITQTSADDYREIIKTVTAETILHFDNAALRQISNIACDDGNYRVAELAERTIVRRRPCDRRSHITLAIVIELQGRYKEACDQRLAIQAMDPNDGENLTRIEFLKLKIASTKQRSGKPTIYEKLCKADLAVCSRAEIEYAIKEAVSLKDNSNLLRFAEEHTRRFPAHRFGYVYKAIALERLGQFQEALDIRARRPNISMHSPSQKINASAVVRLQEKIQAAAEKVVI